MRPEPTEPAGPKWVFFLEWKETRKSDATGELVVSEFAEPIGPYASEHDAKQARIRYLGNTGWMPTGGHDPVVSELQRIGNPERKAFTPLHERQSA